MKSSISKSIPCGYVLSWTWTILERSLQTANTRRPELKSTHCLTCSSSTRCFCNTTSELPLGLSLPVSLCNSERQRHLLKAGWCQRSFSCRVRETWVCIQFLDENSFLVVCLLQLEMTHLRRANLIGTGEKGNYLQRELQHKCRMTLISQTLKCSSIYHPIYSEVSVERGDPPNYWEGIFILTNHNSWWTHKIKSIEVLMFTC